MPAQEYMVRLTDHTSMTVVVVLLFYAHLTTLLLSRLQRYLRVTDEALLAETSYSGPENLYTR